MYAFAVFKVAQASLAGWKFSALLLVVLAVVWRVFLMLQVEQQFQVRAKSSPSTPPSNRPLEPSPIGSCKGFQAFRTCVAPCCHRRGETVCNASPPVRLHWPTGPNET